MVRTEVGHQVRGVSQAELQHMYRGVVDTVLNRVVSDHYPNSVKGVINQLNQFSAIFPRAVASRSTDPIVDGMPIAFNYTVGQKQFRVEAWRDVDWVNMDYLISDRSEREEFSEYIRDYIRRRGSSPASHPHLNYFNPHGTNPDRPANEWTLSLWDFDEDEPLDGTSVAGKGNYLHVHGTSPGHDTVSEYRVVVEGSGAESITPMPEKANAEAVAETKDPKNGFHEITRHWQPLAIGAATVGGVFLGSHAWSGLKQLLGGALATAAVAPLALIALVASLFAYRAIEDEEDVPEWLDDGLDIMAQAGEYVIGELSPGDTPDQVIRTQARQSGQTVSG